MYLSITCLEDSISQYIYFTIRFNNITFKIVFNYIVLYLSHLDIILSYILIYLIIYILQKLFNLHNLFLPFYNLSKYNSINGNTIKQ